MHSDKCKHTDSWATSQNEIAILVPGKSLADFLWLGGLNWAQLETKGLVSNNRGKRDVFQIVCTGIEAPMDASQGFIQADIWNYFKMVISDTRYDIFGRYR